MAIIKINTPGKYVIDNDLIDITKPCCIECTLPLNISYLSEPFFSETLDKQVNKYEHIELVPFKNDCYSLYIKPAESYINSPLQELLYETVSDINVSVFVSNVTAIYIYRHGSMLHNIVVPRFSEAYLQKSQRHIVIMLSNDSDKYCIILDKEYNIVYNDYFTKIEIDDSVVVVLKSLNDCLHHAKVYKFYEDKEEYLVYLDKDIIDEPIAIKFMDAITAQNYDYAVLLLKEDLVPSRAKFEAFFGNIYKYYYNEFTDGEWNFTTYGDNGYKNISLKVKNNIIEDIVEEDL